MPSYVIRRLPPGLIPRAKAIAREHGISLDDALLAFLVTFADGTDRAAAGRRGGAARAEALTAERRTEIARKGAEARWQGNKERSAADV
jgi:hypothetical protein